MLDAKILDIARRMTDVAFEERREALKIEIEMMMSKFAIQGASHSSGALQQIHAMCAREIRLRTEIAWLNLWRVVRGIGARPSEIFAADLKREVEEQIVASLRELYEILDYNQKRTVGPNPGWPTRSPEIIEEAKALAMKRTGAEIDLFVESLRGDGSDAGSASGVTMNFYSPVGAVQTGAGATANVIQNVDSGDRDALLRALDLVEERLNALQGTERSDVLEMTTEVRTEIEKPRPNFLRLKSIAHGVGTAIQTVGTLREAYETLKAALVPFGVMLP